MKVKLESNANRKMTATPHRCRFVALGDYAYCGVSLVLTNSYKAIDGLFLFFIFLVYMVYFFTARPVGVLLIYIDIAYLA